MTRLPRVYLAGKVGHTDWRHELFPLRHVELHYNRVHDVVELNEDTLERDGFEYAGPYFLGDDHGCFHGPNLHGIIDPGWADGHGQADPGFPQQLERRTVVRSCLRWLSSADVVFCWLNSLDAYGTLIELGYAHARGIPIYVATDGAVLKRATEEWESGRSDPSRWIHGVPDMVYAPDGSEKMPSPWADIWFAREMAHNFEHEWSVEAAWEGFSQWWSKRNWSPGSQRRLWIMETMP